MNSDDPKLTAYALDEFDPAERAEIEQLLRENPDARAEVEETKTFTARLQRELKAEAGAPLTDAQRAEVLALGEAQPVADVVAFAAGSNGSRWTRLWLPLAAAVVIVAGVSTLMLNHAAFLQRKASPDMTAVIADNNLFAVKVSAWETAALQRPAETPLAAVEQINTASRALPSTPITLGNLSVGPLANGGGQDEVRLLAASEGTFTSLISGPSPGDSVTMGGTSHLTKSGSGQFDDPSAVSASASDPNAQITLSGANTYTGTTTISAGTLVTNETAARERPASRAPTKPQIQTMNVGARLALDSSSAAGRESWNFRSQHDFGDSPAPTPAPAESSTAIYDAITDNAFLAVREAPLSTFSIDVDTASYAIVRRFLNEQHLPPKGAVRIEELINYFTYDYPQPEGDAPFSATMEVATCPWTPEHRLVRIGLKGREIAKDKRPASNLVFLIDVSGSMNMPIKLPLLKQSLGLLIDQLGAEDQVAMVVYAGNSGCVLEPTHSKAKMRAALGQLEAGGSTNGASGIQLAYQLAEKSFIKGGTNRVILATDGDWNVGVTNPAELFDMIAKKAKSGVFLTVLGFGMDNLNDSMLVKLADKGNGNYAYIDTLIEARKVFVEQLSSTLVTIAKDVKIQVEFNPAQVSGYRLIGYEKRLLAKEDFNDDTKDAGEIGAGHTVTALYEVVPAGAKLPGGPAVDGLKYQTVESQKSAIRNPQSAISPELLTLKLRYKAPDGDTSKLLEFPLTDRGETWEKSSRDFRFAAAVAGYGMLLRESPHKGTATWDSVRELAMEGRGEDRSGYRAEFLTMIDKAKALGR